MGFAAIHPHMVFPRCIIHMLHVLGFIQRFLCCIFRLLHLTQLIECIVPASQNASDQATQPKFQSTSAILIKEMLPVVRFRDLCTKKGVDPCVICMGGFGRRDEVRPLKNCEHVFHRRCLDRWMDCDRQTCPLCRVHLVPEEMRKEFEEQLWLAEEALYHLHDDWLAWQPEGYS